MVSRGASMRRAVWMCVCVVWSLVWGGVCALECPAGCECSADELVRVYCADVGAVVKARDDGFVEVECLQESPPLQCSLLPRLHAGGAGALRRLEVTRCTLSPSRSLAPCAARAEGDGARALALQSALGPITAENVRGMEGVESLFMQFMPGAQTSFPVDVLEALPSLRRVRLLSGSSLSLGADMFSRSPPLAHLEVAMSGVPSLPPNAFRGLKNLTTLSLWKNRIQDVDKDAFSGLESLEELVLNSNPLGALPAGMLSRSHRLRRACLERVRITRLPRGVLSDLPTLQELKLRSDVELSLDPKALSNLPSLQSLSLPLSKIPSLPADLFEGTDHLVNLTLSDNSIQSIPRGVFGNLSALQRLDLSGNKIVVISRDMFRNLSALVEIDLDRNLIEELPELLFSGLTQLTRVSLNSNRVWSISLISFVGAGSLRALSLSHNRLTWEDDERESSSPFNMLHNLKSLSLSHNNISYVYSDWRFVLRELTTLDLSHNAFEALSVSQMQFLPSGRLTVDLRHNRVWTVQPRAPWDTSGTGGTSGTGATLLLDDNPFLCDCRLYGFLKDIRRDGQYSVQAATCASPKTLRDKRLLSLSLDAVSCDLPDVACDCRARPARAWVECDCDSPDQVPDISESGYSNMSLRLRSLAPAPEEYLSLEDPVSLTGLPAEVTFLNLSGLSLHSVPALPSGLQTLDLSHNALRAMPPGLHADIRLRLAGNPLSCGCDDLERFRLLKNRSDYIDDYSHVTCAGGLRPALTAEAALCAARRAAMFAGACACGALALCGALAAMYRWRLELRVWLHARGVPLRWLERNTAEQWSLPYDVFVSCAAEDERWVAVALLPRLRAHVSLVQARDWEPGACIPAQLAKSAAASRRVLVVVSRAFLQGTWSGATLHAARAAAAARRRPALLVLTDVRRAELPAGAAALATVLHVTDTMFWERLMYALPRVREEKTGHS